MKLNRIMLTCWIVWLAAGLAVSAISSEDQKLFEKALLMEETQGRLEEAIALYRQIVDQTKDEALAAQAQLHIGLSYEKLGREAALEAYRIVIERYPLQLDAADQARSRLAELAPRAPARMVARRVWSGLRDFSGAVSPDGRFITFADWDTANLGVYDVASGEIRHATTGGTWDNETYNYHETSAWSPDGRQLVYTRWFGDRYELRIKKVYSPDTDSRLIYRNPDVWGPYEGGWSPDGKFISLILARDDGTHQIAVYSVDEDAVKVLKSVDWRWPIVSAFSPDSRFFAYSFPPEEKSANRDIYLMAPDGSREVHLIDHPADDYFMGWMPDGSVLFASDRSDGYGLWKLRVKDGKAEGEPVLLQPNFGEVIPMGTTRTGSLYYGVWGGGGWDAFTVAFNPERAEITGALKRVNERRPGRNASVTWSSDGKRMAYVSGRGLTRFIVVRSQETGEEREITLSLQPRAIRWFPDGESMLVIGQNRNLKGAFRVWLNQPDARTEFLFEGSTANRMFVPEISPDGKAVYAIGVQDGAQPTIGKYTVSSGEFESLFEREPDHIRPRFGLSPDGKHLALATGPVDGPQQLSVLSTTSGESHVLDLKYPDGPIRFGDGLIWSRDGRHLLFVVLGKADEVGGERLMRVSSHGGTVESVAGDQNESGAGIWGDSSPTRFRHLNFHPDGKTLGFIGLTEGVAPSAIWVLENLTTAPEDN